jgi:hypothetical protein
MLLAEELALVALDPDSGRHAVGIGSLLNACLAGLLVAELLLDGTARAGDRDDAVVLTDRPRPAAKALAGAAEIVAEKGPKVKAILSHMNRGLEQHAGAGTWDLAVAGLVQAGIVARRAAASGRTTTCSTQPPRTSWSLGWRPRQPATGHSIPAPPWCCR